MEANIDIFRDLDTSLLEIFQRGQFNQYLDRIPPNERNQRIDNINRAIRHRREAQQRQQQYYHIKWLFTYFPVLIIHFDEIWRNLTWATIQRYLFEFVTNSVMLLIRAIRFMTFVVGSGVYFQGIVRRLFVFCDVITFSDNFTRDVFTYILKDSPHILNQLELIQFHHGNMMFFLQYEEYNNLSSFEVIKLSYYNIVASMVRADCVVTSESATCKILTNTLVFKFSQVLRDFFPSLSITGLKTITLMIYLTYAIIGDIICLNILLFLSYNLMNRFLGYKQVFVGIRGMLWNSFFKFLV
ncbi:hypothetical protein SBY92_003029 [Candida maltosa Xu316]